MNERAIQDTPLQLQQLALKIAQITLKKQHLPETLEGEFPLSELADPWGTTIRYDVLQFQTGEFRLSSAGPDKTFGTADDIVFESRRRP